jgi:hypothetical protein
MSLTVVSAENLSTISKTRVRRRFMVLHDFEEEELDEDEGM